MKPWHKVAALLAVLVGAFAAVSYSGSRDVHSMKVTDSGVVFSTRGGNQVVIGNVSKQRSNVPGGTDLAPLAGAGASDLTTLSISGSGLYYVSFQCSMRTLDSGAAGATTQMVIVSDALGEIFPNDGTAGMICRESGDFGEDHCQISLSVFKVLESADILRVKVIVGVGDESSIDGSCNLSAERIISL